MGSASLPAARRGVASCARRSRLPLIFPDLLGLRRATVPTGGAPVAPRPPLFTSVLDPDCEVPLDMVLTLSGLVGRLGVHDLC